MVTAVTVGLVYTFWSRLILNMASKERQQSARHDSIEVSVVSDTDACSDVRYNIAD